MIDIRPLSSSIYRRLLVLYPEDLRRDYGPEMALVFADDLDAARRDQGLRGVLHVWRCALGEFFRLALPERLSSPAVRVPAIASAIFSVAMTAQISALWRHSPDVPAFFHALGVALTLPVFGTPFISLLAVWTCRGDRPVSLQLHQERPSCSKSAI